MVVHVVVYDIVPGGRIVVITTIGGGGGGVGEGRGYGVREHV